MGYEEVVRRAVDEIERRLDDAPDFRELAASAYVSPYHFHRLFGALVGESPRELARRLRLERAAVRLRQEATPINEVADEAGYAAPEAFTKSFQAAYGVSPSAFRAGGGDCETLRAASGVHFVRGRFTAFHPLHRGGLPMKVEVVDVPEQRVAAVRHTGAYWQIGKAFEQLAQRAPQILATPGANMVAAFYDDQETVPEADLRSIAGVLVGADVPVGDLEEVWLPGGRYVKAQYRGHPSGLPQAWSVLYGQHIADGDYELRDGITFEVYVVGHEVGDPDLMQTDLYAPVN
jgi:AraC family transcriptional regulator